MAELQTQELKKLLEKVKELHDIIMKDDDKTGSIMIHINQGKIAKPSVTIKQFLKIYLVQESKFKKIFDSLRCKWQR